MSEPGFKEAMRESVAAAGCLGMAGVGTLEAGNWADPLVLGSSLLEDIEATRTPEKVFVAGTQLR